jgi:hypothetical protein
MLDAVLPDNEKGKDSAASVDAPSRQEVPTDHEVPPAQDSVEVGDHAAVTDAPASSALSRSSLSSGELQNISTPSEWSLGEGVAALPASSGISEGSVEADADADADDTMSERSSNIHSLFSGSVTGDDIDAVIPLRQASPYLDEP